MSKKVAIIDIESSSLLENLIDYSSLPYKLKPEAKLWVVVVRDLETGEEFCAEKEDITKEWLQKVLEPYYYIVAHNGVKFDYFLLSLFNMFDYKIGYLGEEDTLFGRPCKFLDSLILSKLANPDRLGRHSLEAWGRRVGEFKDDYRQKCIDAGHITKDAPKGEEFANWNPLMLPYCKQDCKTNAKAFLAITKEFNNHNWKTSIHLEHKLADLSIRREHFGFSFDKEMALQCLDELNAMLDGIANKIEPLLPPKPLNVSETSFWTPPVTQLKKNGEIGVNMVNFLANIGAELVEKDTFRFEGMNYKMPYHLPLKTHSVAKMKDMDHIKSYLIELGWVPTEWGDRDLTKDSKKQNLTFEKREKAFERWWKETQEGKYTRDRLKELGFTKNNCYDKIMSKLGGDFPVKVPTAPKIRVGVEKDLCPNLIKLGDKVGFAKDYADYLTYRHRRNSIAGGDTDDLDLSEEDPTSGFLKQVRDIDGRIPTPADEIGAVTNRYTHKNVANIPRPSSVYGKEMRSLFKAGDGGAFFGFDYASLEARIMAHYVHRYKGGPELGLTFVAEKPNDFHTLQANIMGIDRTSAKSVDYGIIYGAQPNKIVKMLSVPKARAEEILSSFWEGAPALKELRDNLTKFWESTDKKYILGIDGRKINVRSKHSLLNSLFQSAGVIYAKYVSVLIMEEYEKLGLNIDPFKGPVDITSMIEYHDEEALWVDPKLLKFKKFKTEEEAKEFKKNWTGSQLSAISHNEKGYYIVLPTDVSTVIEEAMKKTTQFLKINVEMGFEYMVGRNWYECH